MHRSAHLCDNLGHLYGKGTYSMFVSFRLLAFFPFVSLFFLLLGAIRRKRSLEQSALDGVIEALDGASRQ